MDAEPPSGPEGGHVYDDIHEEDNKLPGWWLTVLYGTTAFAVFYWYGDQELKAWASPRERFDDEQITRLASASKGGMSSDALISMSKDPNALTLGRATFTSICAACHRADGGGNIGPNLTDEFWLHGGAPDQIWKTVHDGVTNKGMPAWGPQLGEAKVAGVVAYVLTLRNTHVAGGKAPQGEPEP